MNLKVPGAILPLGCAILSTRAKTVRGGWYNPPLGELGLIIVVMSFSTGPFERSGDHFSRTYKKPIMMSVVHRSAMSIGQSLLLIIQTLMSPDHSQQCVLNQRNG